MTPSSAALKKLDSSLPVSACLSGGSREMV